MKIGRKEFDVKQRTHVMGILNVTPDSFSDGGSYVTMESALRRADEMIKQGAEILDVGGESTRPGYLVVSVSEEIERVCPVIEKIKETFDIPISLDTYKGAVAKAGIAAGADMINDIWGLQYDSEMGQVVAESKVPYCLMHNRKENVAAWGLSDFIMQMKEDMQRALSQGIKKEQLLYDPGIGFAKTQEQNLLVIGNLDKYNKEQIPILLGTSRKSVIGYVLDLPLEQRLEGTLATTAEAVFSKTAFVRVHDVKENVRFIQMLQRTQEKWVR